AVLMLRHQHRPFAEVEPFLVKAVGYYPRQQREAARMLKNRGEERQGNGNDPRSLRGNGGAAGAAAQGGVAEALARVRAEAEQRAKDGDLDAALAVLDKAARELKDYAPFQALRGDYNLRYARAARD